MGIFDRFGKKNSKVETSPGGSVIHRYSEENWASTPVGFTGESSIAFGKARDEVYRKRFGEAKQVYHELIPMIPHIDVMEYYRSSESGPVCTLVTSGMSDLPMNVPAKVDAPRRVELIFYCKEARKEFADTMRWLAHFPHDQKTWVGAFHTIPNGNPPVPLWGSKSLDTLFLLPSIVKKDTTLAEDLVLDGDGVEFLWIVPITTAECKLKLKKGSDAVLDLLQQNKHPYIFNADRGSYV